MKKILVGLMVALAATFFVSCDSDSSSDSDVAKTYKVGETGPAGGIIFYVNPNASTDKWTYLEAGKSDLGNYSAYAWSSAGSCACGTKTDVGEGMSNTEILSVKGGNYAAANSVYGDKYNNGFKDWFLPSKDELNLMYENLAKKGLGSFTSNYYWSSSEDGDDKAWRQKFSDGSQDSVARSEGAYLRPARRF